MSLLHNYTLREDNFAERNFRGRNFCQWSVQKLRISESLLLDQGQTFFPKSNKHLRVNKKPLFKPLYLYLPSHKITNIIKCPKIGNLVFKQFLHSTTHTCWTCFDVTKTNETWIINSHRRLKIPN